MSVNTARRSGDIPRAILVLALVLLAGCVNLRKEYFAGLPEPFSGTYSLPATASDAWAAIQQELEIREVVRVLAREPSAGLLAWTEELPWAECTNTLPQTGWSTWETLRAGVFVTLGLDRFRAFGTELREPALVLWALRVHGDGANATLRLRATCLSRSRATWAPGLSLGKLENPLAASLVESLYR